MDELLIAIVGGTISTVLGGLILKVFHSSRPSGSQFTNYSGNANARLNIFKWLLLLVANIAIIFLLFIMFPSATSNPEAELLFKVLAIIIFNVMAYSSFFLGINFD